MKDRNKDKLDNNVKIDEMIVGVYSEGKVGRNMDKKVAVMNGCKN